MPKLSYLASAVMALLLGAPAGAKAATSPQADPGKPAPEPILSQAARTTLAQVALDRSRIRAGRVGQDRYSFARESGPSWVNSPRKIDRLNNIKVLPQYNQRYR